MAATKNVKVFSTPSCPWCAKVKAYLRQNGIRFQDINVAQNLDEARKMVERSNQRGVPQLWINGTVVVGFDQEKIDRLLGL